MNDILNRLVMPNMLSSGSAYYPSEFVPMSGEEDELAKCIEAAHRHGIEVHVWKGGKYRKIYLDWRRELITA